MKKLTIKKLKEVKTWLSKSDGENTTEVKNATHNYGIVDRWVLNEGKLANEDVLLDKLKKLMVLSGSRAYGFHTENSDWDFFTTNETVFRKAVDMVKENAIAVYEQRIGWYIHNGGFEIHKYRVIDKDGGLADIQLSLVETIMDKQEAMLHTVAKKIVLNHKRDEYVMKYGDEELKEAYENAMEVYIHIMSRMDFKWFKRTDKGAILVDDKVVGVAIPYDAKSYNVSTQNLSVLDLILMKAKLNR